MKILITRTMRLGGERCEAGKVVNLPDAEAELALRHGWAVTPPQAAAKAKDKPADKADEAGQGD